MIIGIKQTPQTGALPKIEVFYVGRDGVEFRKNHAALVTKDNPEGTKFFSITNPLLVPLQNVVHSTEDHPDVIAANARRAEIAKQALPKVKTEQTELSLAEQAAHELAEKSAARAAELAARTKADLLNEFGKAIELKPEMKKIEIINAILVSERLTPAAADASGE